MFKKVFTFIKKYLYIFLLLLALFCYVIARFLNNFHYILDQFYSSSLNKWFIQALSLLTGLVPFSIAEFLVIGHAIAIPIVIIILIYKIIKRKFFRFFKFIISYMSLIYILFMLLWGFNYSRTSISETVGLEIKQSDTEELYQASKVLLLKANALREQVEEDDDGIFTISGGYQSIFNRAQLGYDKIGEDYKQLAGKYGKPKFILLSEPMLYTGIVGVYFPFTSEANVNVAGPLLFTPVDALHEMAHQRGFASEDEANYIAYLTAVNHPDLDFQYSGVVSALTSTMNSLWTYEPEKASELLALYSEGLRRDLDHFNDFCAKYASKAGDIASDVNDSYLKGNGQTDGVESYGKVVDLLLAHYRKFGDL